MKQTIQHILQGISGKLIGDDKTLVESIVFDSRKVKAGDVFVAVKGTQADGHLFIQLAIDKGAVLIVCETLPENIQKNTTYFQVSDSAFSLGQIAANFYNHPSKKLKLIGVTGTNGKTSISTLSHKMLTAFGFKCGLLSTVRNLIGNVEVTATHTTPDAVAIQALMNEMVESGCTYAFMEVSSHAADQQRIAGLNFDIAIFTNLTHDHLDYHKTFDAYLKAKKLFFDHLPNTAVALVNADDKHGKVMVQNTKASIKTYGIKSIADFKAKIIESHFDGTLINIENKEVWSRLIGEFNVSNLLAVYGVGILLGFSVDQVLREISNLTTVEGRFEYVKSNTGITAIVDYAHTPDALKNVLTTINQIRGGAGKLITVMGAGGDRDKTKRPAMGRIAADLSTRVIITSDNPRSEDPATIISEIFAGITADKTRNVLQIVDRREAIRTACMLAATGDILLIAGKGHENYQEINKKKKFFSDKQTVAEFFMLNNINPQ